MLNYTELQYIYQLKSHHKKSVNNDFLHVLRHCEVSSVRLKKLALKERRDGESLLLR